MRITIIYHVYIVALNQCFVCRSLFGLCISLKTIGLLSYNGVLFSFLLSACRTQVAGEYTRKQGLGMKFQRIRATAKYLSFAIQLYKISSYIATTAQLWQRWDKDDSYYFSMLLLPHSLPMLSRMRTTSA
jgi:hypothetical protein